VTSYSARCMKPRRLQSPIDAADEKWGALTTPSIAMKNGKPHINLSRLNRDILRDAGVPGTQLFQIGPCTSCAIMIFLLPPRRR